MFSLAISSDEMKTGKWDSDSLDFLTFAVKIRPMPSSPIHLHTIYRSNEQFHVRFVNGERKEEPYYLYYLFRADGVWISKTEEDPRLSEDEFWDEIDEAWVTDDPDHDEPMTEDDELFYQVGTYEIKNETVYLTWRNTHLEEKKRTWYFRIRSADLLETDFEEVILQPISTREH